MRISEYEVGDVLITMTALPDRIRVKVRDRELRVERSSTLWNPAPDPYDVDVFIEDLLSKLDRAIEAKVEMEKRAAELKKILMSVPHDDVTWTTAYPDSWVTEETPSP